MPQTDQPVAVQFGAGNIGRGFMGELFWQSGYRVVFVDVDTRLVEALATRGRYDVHHITNAGDSPVTVTGVTAIDGRQLEAVAGAVAGASLVCTAVGVRALGAVVPALAAGLARRLAAGKRDCLNIITCENLIGAGRLLRDLVWRELEPLLTSLGMSADAVRPVFDERFGFVEAVVSRMVPIVPDDVRRLDPTWVACEPYWHLPVDARAIRGAVPTLTGMQPVPNILAHQTRKLASHNMSHALCAYLGYPAGYEFIWQAVADDSINRTVRAAMAETGKALVARFGFDPHEQQAYEEDLLERYANRALGDQVRRVAADPIRKLGPNDRLIGAARLCLEEGVEPAGVLRGIEAALAYDFPADPSAARLQELLRSQGRGAVLREICGLSPEEPLWSRLAGGQSAISP